MAEITKNPRFISKKSVEFPLDMVEVWYAHLNRPDTKYENAWKVNIILPKATADSFLAVGFNVKEKDFKDGKGVRSFVIAKKKTHTASGDALYAPKIFQQNGKDLWDKDTNIGNGSIMNLKVAARYMEINGKTLLPLYINSGQVVNLVEYISSPFEDTTGETNKNSDVPF